MEKRGRGDERQVIKRQEKRVVGEVLGATREEWTEGKGRNGREGLRRREERGKVRVDRVELQTTVAPNQLPKSRLDLIGI
jgi:hypothetical protein